MRDVPGANYWSRRPVTRMDLAVGAYDEISSADVAGFRESLERAMPGLIEHHCSIGERGGFLVRLERGTYAPHIVEHVAIELQNMIGHEINFGKTRGGNAAGEYTIIFDHLNAAVGLRAAILALDIVQRAFAGTLGDVSSAVSELRAIAALPVPEPEQRSVAVAITGGTARAETRDELVRLGVASESVVDISPAQILAQGLPIARCDVAIILDAKITDVPHRYRDNGEAANLVGVLCDAAEAGGIVVAPRGEDVISSRAISQRCRLAIFSLDERAAMPSRNVIASASITSGRIDILRAAGLPLDSRFLRAGAPAVSQIAAALAAAVLNDARGQ